MGDDYDSDNGSPQFYQRYKLWGLWFRKLEKSGRAWTLRYVVTEYDEHVAYIPARDRVMEAMRDSITKEMTRGISY